MPALKILFVTLVSALAVIGAYSLLREALLSVFTSREITVAVILRSPVDGETLDILLDEATRHPRRRRGQRVALVVPCALAELATTERELLDRYRAEVYVSDLREE